jgi:hypothetical protein
VSEISSVRLDEGTIEMRYGGRKLRLLETDDFADFLARLKTAEPRGRGRWTGEMGNGLMSFEDPLLQATLPRVSSCRG